MDKGHQESQGHSPVRWVVIKFLHADHKYDTKSITVTLFFNRKMTHHATSVGIQGHRVKVIKVKYEHQTLYIVTIDQDIAAQMKFIDRQKPFINPKYFCL